MRVVLLLPLLLLATPAQAHKLKVFATVEGAEIVGSAYFVGGEKAVSVPGRLIGADGTAQSFLTDAEGGFRLSVPSRQGYTVLVEAEDGHAAAMDLPADGFAPALPQGRAVPTAAATVDAAALEAVVARQIRPLREQLDAYEAKTRLHDVLGGIGTIFGLFGVWAWLQSRRTGS